MAISEDMGSFSDISESELIVIVLKFYYCTAILTNITKLMSFCQNRVLRIESELWLTLHSKTSWIFSVNNPTIAEISTEYGEKY